MKLGIIGLAVLIASCSNSKSEAQSENLDVSRKQVPSDTIPNRINSVNSIAVKDTTLSLSYNEYSCEIVIKAVPNQLASKNILLLHGWNLPHTEWCEKTALCQMAIDSGYNVIMPNFGKSTYQWEVYPETIDKYRPYPTRKWMYQTFLAYCKDSLGLLKQDQYNAVVGLSTGGRGSALFALEHPDVFDACVSLSADFDQTKISDEPINNGFYGAYKSHPDRWEGKDNIYNRAEEWKVPIYLGHGSLDQMCPTEQTHNFHAKLQELGFEDVELSIMNKGHDYDYWDAETENIVEFLEKYWSKNEQPLSK